MRVQVVRRAALEIVDTLGPQHVVGCLALFLVVSRDHGRARLLVVLEGVGAAGCVWSHSHIDGN